MVNVTPRFVRPYVIKRVWHTKLKGSLIGGFFFQIKTSSELVEEKLDFNHSSVGYELESS